MSFHCPNDEPAAKSSHLRFIGPRLIDGWFIGGGLIGWLRRGLLQRNDLNLDLYLLSRNDHSHVADDRRRTRTAGWAGLGRAASAAIVFVALAVVGFEYHFHVGAHEFDLPLFGVRRHGVKLAIIHEPLVLLGRKELFAVFLDVRHHFRAQRLISPLRH